MSFKSNIPEQVLAHPNTRKFVSVMDGVNEVKSDIIFTSLRAYNPALLLDKNWLLKRLGDYGVDFIPMEFPLPVIQQFLLNADIILGTRGSKKGVELFLSVMTLRTVLKVLLPERHWYLTELIGEREMLVLMRASSIHTLQLISILHKVLLIADT